MIDSPLTWGAIIVALGSIIIAVKFWMDMGETRADAKAARESAKDAHQRIDRLTENVATGGDLNETERRFTEAVNGMRADFQHLVGRIDGFITALASK